MREQQVRAVFRAALELPPAKRASFIADLTGDDVELRQSVELLLSKHDETDVGARTAQKGEASPELPAGTVVGGHYRIDAVLGRGGMGVVYRATDTKLQRPVAIKFLAAAVGDAEVRRRFKQEAETTSGLNHPHIVTVYDVDEHDGRQYIVSELVDGGTLDDWSKSGRKRSWRESVELLTGIADALAAAHAAGVLHRDVKPANILIDGNGYAKLADFGLAKLVATGSRDPAALSKPSRDTRAGVVVGTIAYMSPEQAAGQPLDARNDVFSFGIVLYEQLAGRRPFEADNELEVLKSIAHATPPQLPDTVPESLRAIVDKALEKNPADRYQTMQDLVVDLRRLTRRQAGSQTATSVSAERRRARVLSMAVAGLAVALVAALAGVGLLLYRPAAAPDTQIRFEIAAPGVAPNGLAVSPDGQQIAYAAELSGVRQIWVRPIDALAARALPNTEGAQGIFWSPDSRRLAFNADAKLKTVEVTGGPATTVTDASRVPLAGDWSRAGTMLVTMVDPAGAIAVGRVPSVGGSPTPVTTPTATGDLAHFLPSWLPDDEHFLYAARKGVGAAFAIYAGAARGADRVALAEADSGQIGGGFTPNVRYAEGFLLYPSGSTLLARRFAADSLHLQGEAVPLLENVAEFSVAGNTLVYRAAATERTAGTPVRTQRLAWFDRTGQRVGEIETPPAYRYPVLAPDDRRVALNAPAADSLPDIWTIDAQRGTTTRLTFSDAVDLFPVWSPDGARILFSSGRDGIAGVPSSLYVRAANGTGTDERLLSGQADELVVPFDWSSDGRFLLFGRAPIATFGSRFDLWTLELTGERTAAPLIESPFMKELARFSPDGRFVSYTSNESNGDQVFVQPFPDLGRGKWQISTRGGTDARWRADGRELFYLDPDGVLMAVDVAADGDTFEWSPPRPLFKTGVTLYGAAEARDYFYDVTGDGQRFLINEPVPPDSNPPAAPGAPDAQATGSLTVIVNWAAGLREK